MKKLLLILCASIGLAAITTSQAEILIRFSHVVDENTPKGQAANYFAELVKDRLEGDVTVEVFPNGTLFNDTDAIIAIQKDPEDNKDNKQVGLIIAPSLSILHALAPALKVFDLPGLFEGQSDIDKLTNSPVAGEIIKEIESNGLISLAFWHNGMRMFSLQLDGDVTEDLAFLKDKSIRIEDSKIQAAFIESLGATPKPLEFTELTSALKNNTVDGQTNTWSNMYTQDVHKYQNYIFEPGLTYLGYLVLVNKKFWDGLPPLTQRQLQWAIGEATYVERELAKKLNEQQRQEIISAKSTQVVTLSKEQQALWLNSADQIEAQFSHEIGQDLLKEVHELLGH